MQVSELHLLRAEPAGAADTQWILATRSITLRPAGSAGAGSAGAGVGSAAGGSSAAGGAAALGVQDDAHACA